MVAIFTGAGTGFERGSGNVIGAAGLLGSAAQGRGGDNLFLNAANGNLMISRQDEFLSGRGPDVGITRTYNSLGNFSDDNGDNWRQSMDRRVFGLTGTANSSGSKVKRRGADGAEISYDWDGSAYVATDGSGSYDTLTYNGTNWTWTDGDSRITEVYSAYGSEWRIASQSDTSGNSLSFSYTGANLTQITTADGGYTQLTWDGSNITSLVTYSHGTGLTRTRYGYDIQNRLSQVTVDLSPEDSSIIDDKVYTTNYSYHGSSKLVATISQTDGSHVAFTYDGSGRVDSITQTVSSGVTRTTSIAYGSGTTTITDPMGQATTLHYDGNGQLTRITAPPAQAGAPAQTVTFAYNAAGELIRSIDAGGTVTSYSYDARGNLLTRSDQTSLVIQSGPNATATLQPDGTYRISKTGGAHGVYDAQVQSVQGISGDFALRMRPLQTNKYMMAGVSQNPNYSTGYGDISFAIEAADNSLIYYYDSVPGSYGVLTPYVAGNSIWMVRTGSTINYYKGDTLETAIAAGSLRTISGASGTYYFDSAHYEGGGQADVSLTPLAPSNVVTRTYNAANQVLTETRTGSNGTAANASHTTRYVYDDLNRLVYVVSAEGHVTRNWYNEAPEYNGLLYRIDEFPEHRYDVSALTPATALSRAELDSWYANLQATAGGTSSFNIRYIGYDGRGNIAAEMQGGSNDGAGSITETDGYQRSFFTYDQAGQLLSRSRLTQYTEHFVYDGLGRLIMTTDLNTGTTSIIFNDALTQTEVRLASGLIQTSAYSKAGELLSFTESGTFTTVGTANYAYDKNGRLRVATDATGVTHYYLYDKAGRKTAEINEDGDLIEYRYDARNRLVATARYALRITDGANLLAIADPNSTIDVAAIRPPLPHDFDLWTWHVYDADGRLLQAIDGDGSTTSYDYDASGQLVRTISYFNKLTAAQIAAFKIAAPVAVILPSTDPKDAISRVFYDKDGRTIGTLDGAGYLTQVTYDRAGRKTREVAYAKATDPALRASGTFQQLTNSTNPNPNPANRQINYVYDGQGLLRYQIDGLGQVTEYGYDSGVAGSSIGLVRKVTGYATLIDFSSTGYSFAAVKAAIASSGAASNAANRTSWAVYDTAGRVAYAIDAGGAVTGYSYDVRGQVTKQIQYATLRPTSSLPTDATMNDWALANPAQADRVTRYYRNERGETVFTVNPEGYATKTEYDAAGRKLAVRVRWDTKIEPDNSWTLAMVSAAVAGGSFVTNYYYYDNAGRLQQEYDGEFNLKWYTYYANGQLQWEISDYGGPDEVRILHEYDAAGRERYRYEAWGTPERALTEFSYDGLGNLQSVTAPGGRTTSYTHDSLGRVLTQTNAASGTTSYQYNAFGEVVRTTDQRGNSSYSYYDAQGRVVVSRDAENYLTLTSYTVFGEIETVTRKAIATNSPISLDVIPTAGPSTQDAVTRFTYDKLGRIKTTTDALENIETRWYDAFGNLSQTRNKLDGLVQYAHDRRGLLTHEYVQAPVYGGTGAQLASGFYRNIYAYDARGNMVHQIEASGLPEQRDTWFAYDRADRLISKTGGTVKTQLTDIDATPVESYTYDKRGNLIETRVEAVVGSTRTVISRTLFYYDDLDRKVAQVDPTGTVTRYAYDAAGNLKSTRAFDDRIALPTTAGGTPPAHGGTSRDNFYDYDNLGRLTKSYTAAQATGYWDAVTQQFVRQSVEVATLYEYDAAGNVTKTTDANGNVTLSYYDKLGRKTAQLDQERYQTSWTYDAEGNVLKERRFAARLPVDDPLFDIDAATIGYDRITEFSYDRLGRRLFETRIGVQAWKIDTGPGNALLGDSGNAQIAYTYNALGQVKTKVEANGDKTEYEYDTAGRLIKETRASYTDHTGADVKPELRYFYNALDQLTATRQIGNGTDRLTANVYEDGRLRSTTDAAGFTRTYHYDAAGRLVAESYDRKLPNGGSVTEAIFYVHDAAGRVIAQTFARKDGASWVHADAGNETYVATRMRYNAHGELTGRTTTLGLVPIDEQTGYHETYAYDAFGRMWRTNAGDGVLKFHIYDKAGNQTLTLTSAGADLSLLDISNYTASIVASGDTNTADAVTTITAYDKRGMVTYTRAPDRQINATTATDITAKRTYNAFGEIVSEVDTFGKATSFTYNAMGRLLRKEGPAVWMVHAHGGGQWIKPSDDYYYDISGRLIATRDANGSYGSGGLTEGAAVVKQADTGNLTRRVLLAGTGHGGSEALAVREIRADNHVFRTFYDQFGDARILRNELYYRDDVTGTDNAAVTDENYTYDAMGRVTSVIRRGAQLTEEYRYDGLGQQIEQWNSIQGAGNKALTGYDAYSRVISTIAIGGETTLTGYKWDVNSAGGWIQTVSTNADRVRTDDYIFAAVQHTDLFGRVVTRTDKGNVDYSYTYDLAGRLMTEQSASGALRNNRYTYYNTGQISQIFSGDTPTTDASWSRRVVSYEYDALGRLTLDRLVEEGGSYTEGRWQAPDRGGPAGDPPLPDDPEAEGWSWIPAVYNELAPVTLQDGRASYDALGRIAQYRDISITGGIRVDKNWAYDAVGNVRSIATTYMPMLDNGTITNATTSQTYWYRYDSMNRMLTTKGTLTGTPGSGVISRGSTGTDLTYDNAGQRASSQTGSNAEEIYSYNPAGQLRTVVIGGVTRAYTSYNDLGRVTGYSEYDAWGNGVHSRHTIDYDLRGQVLSEKTWTLQGGDEIRTHTVNHYSADGTGNPSPLISWSGQTGSSSGSLLYYSETKNWKNGGPSPIYGTPGNYSGPDFDYADSYTSQTYRWADAAKQQSVTLDNRDGKSTSSYIYNLRTETLTGVFIGGGTRARHISFTTDLQGQVIARYEGGTAAPIGSILSSRTYMFGGRQMGVISNDGTGNVDYAASIAARTATPGNGPFRGGAHSGTAYADFDANFTAFNGGTVGGGSSGYVASAGETLQSIAGQLWGDPSLWYKLAEANPGLSAGALGAGTPLTIPGGVVGNRHNADTFKPYDPAEAIGNTSPNTPQPPKKNNCGIVGQIILAVVAIAVAVWAGPGLATFAKTALGLGKVGGAIAGGAVAGAAGSAVSQGVGIATGIQERFNWGAVGMAAIAGGIAGGLNAGDGGSPMIRGIKSEFLSNFVNGAAQAAIGGVLSQGLGVVTGLQKKFDWAGVAAGVIGGGLSAGVGGGRFVAPTVDSVASAAARSLITGTSFGDNLIAVLPSVIGRTIGGMFERAVAGAGDSRPLGAQIGDIVAAKLGAENTFTRSGHVQRIGSGKGAYIDQPDGVHSWAGTDVATPAELQPLSSENNDKTGNATITYDTDSDEFVVSAKATERSWGWHVADALGFHKGGFFYNIWNRKPSGQNIISQSYNYYLGPTSLYGQYIGQPFARATEPTARQGLDAVEKWRPIDNFLWSGQNPVRDLRSAARLLANGDFDQFNNLPPTLSGGLNFANGAVRASGALSAREAIVAAETIETATINSRLTTRLGKWRNYQAGGGELDMRSWIKATQGQEWGLGGRGGYGDWIKGVESPHGNSLLSNRTAYLYEKVDADGTFLKWGITQDLGVRELQYIGKGERGIQLFEHASGTRAEMARMERFLEQTQPGPQNLQPWAVKAWNSGLRRVP